MSTRRQESKRARLSVALIGSVWLLGGAAIAADSPSVQPGNDAQITDQVTAALRQIDPTVGRRLVVMTENGVVTLTGQTSPGFARSALQAAKGVPGVTKVRNQMSVMQ
jgi:osmotically-inducible protein OsmY